MASTPEGREATAALRAELHARSPGGDFSLGAIPERVELFAYTMALRSETAALAEYRRVLHAYTDLMLHGIMTEEGEWGNLPTESDRGDSENTNLDPGQ